MSARCPGVLIPDNTRHCFVEERGLWEELANARYADGRRPLQWSLDHFIPKSMGGTDAHENIHVVHLYCQVVQGGFIGGRIYDPSKPSGGLIGGRRLHELHPEHGSKWGLKYGSKGRCKRWNIDRGKPCACGNHK